MDKIKLSSLNNIDCNINYSRHCGNTTRIIDRAIQLIFNGSICEVVDHYDFGRDRQANELLFYKILDRLELEHNLNLLIKDKKIRIDKQKLEIELI